MLGPSGQGLPRRILPGLTALLLLLSVFLALPHAAYSYPYQGYDARQILINKAQEQVGKKYVWGGDGPDTFDCSGLTLYAYAAAGISLPHKSGLIWSMCDTCTAEQLEPGDLVFRARLASGTVQPTKPDDIYHVGIYVGGGRVFEASSQSKPLGWSSLGSFKFFGRLKEKYWPNQDRSYDQPLLSRGDFNGDGREDVASVVKVSSTAIRIQVTASTETTMAPAKTWYASSGSWDWDRTKVASGDFNGDRKTDLALVYGYSDGSVKAWVFYSNGTSFATKTVWWTGAAGALKWEGLKLSAGDVNGDRRADLVALYDKGDNTPRVLVFRSTGSAFVLGTWWSTGSGVVWPVRSTKLAVGDATGDGKADVALLRDTGYGTGCVYLLGSTGTSFSSRGPWYAPVRNTFNFSRVKLQLTDTDGDRKADLVYLYDLGWGSSKIVWARSTGTRLETAKTWWTGVTGQWDWERTRFGSADVDKNGRAEVMMLYDNFSSTARLWRYSTVSGGGLGPIRIDWYSGSGGLDWGRVK